MKKAREGIKNRKNNNLRNRKTYFPKENEVLGSKEHDTCVHFPRGHWQGKREREKGQKQEKEGM